VIEAKSGQMDFDMSWAGAPTADALSDATGHVQLALDKGQIVGLKPGAGRVLGSPASPPAAPIGAGFQRFDRQRLAFDTFAATSTCATATPTPTTSWSRARRRKSA
jgi:hypothetical protein